MTPTATPKLHSRFLLALFLSTLFLMTGCEQKQSEQIQWQLPLQAPNDPHGAQHNLSAVPAWAVSQQGEAEIVWLQKNTSKIFTTNIALGGATRIQNWDIQLLGLAAGLRLKNKAFLNDQNVDNPAALVEIRQGDKLIYRGWLYEKFPELFGMDNPEWKVWLKSITLRPASQEAVKTRLP
ncbi:MAG: DUF2155 domain-containing protein [Mariprofundus sp.]|nr:DUF2155 domain-containing protein [Mariprofundus sp.]